VRKVEIFALYIVQIGHERMLVFGEKLKKTDKKITWRSVLFHTDLAK
jgi:hypothetical protein